MGFNKITNVSLTDLFVQQIENMILSGELEVGEKLPSERELSIRMGVSRPVISAGLIELEKLGFVQIIPRQGTFVCDYRRKGSLETLVAIMRYNGGAMRIHEVISLLQVRESLESLCVKLIIENCSDEDLKSMVPYVEAIRSAYIADDVSNAIFAFHHELAVLSGNMLLPLLYHSFQMESLYLWNISIKKEGKDVLFATKQKLLQALFDRDLTKALAITSQSIENATSELSAYIS